jgi:hypothetical protein
MWPLALLLVTAGSFFGAEVFSLLARHHLDFLTRCGIGSLFGILVSAWLFFIFTLWFPLTLVHGLIHSMVLYILSAVLFLWRRRQKISSPPCVGRGLVIGSIVVPFMLLFGLFHFGFLYREYFVRGACFGDLPFHLNLISSFAHGCNSRRRFLFDLTSPFFAHEKLAYPIIPNFYSAVLFSCFNTSYHFCILLPSLIAAFSVLTVLSRLVIDFSGSDAACCVAPFLFLFSGGLGFTRWFKSEFRNEFFIDYVHFWGKNRYEYWFQTVVHILMPQRASLFSLPLAWAILLLLMGVGGSPAREFRMFLAVGLLVALLPQVQPHSIVAAAQWAIVHLLLRLPWRAPRVFITIGLNFNRPSAHFLPKKFPVQPAECDLFPAAVTVSNSCRSARAQRHSLGRYIFDIIRSTPHPRVSRPIASRPSAQTSHTVCQSALCISERRVTP